MSRPERLQRALQMFLKLEGLPASRTRMLAASYLWVLGGIFDFAMSSVALFTRTGYLEANPYAAYVIGLGGFPALAIFSAITIAPMPVLIFRLRTLQNIVLTDVISLGGVFRILLASITMILLVSTRL